MIPKVSQVVLPNGMVVSSALVTKVFDVLCRLQKMKAPQYSFWEFSHTCRYPKYEMTKDTVKILSDMGFLHADGFIKADVQNIVLFLTEGNEPNIEIIDYSEVTDLFKPAENGKDIE